MDRKGQSQRNERDYRKSKSTESDESDTNYEEDRISNKEKFKRSPKNVTESDESDTNSREYKKSNKEKSKKSKKNDTESDGSDTNYKEDRISNKEKFKRSPKNVTESDESDTNSREYKTSNKEKSKKSQKNDTESNGSDTNYKDVTKKKRESSVGGNTEKVVKIVLLGQTGSGKSTLGNCLLKENVFDVSQAADSCTDETTGETKGDIRVIDCPGLDDSEGRDSNHIENIVEFLKKEKYINTFVLVRNGTNKRLSKSFKSMLTVFELMFGKVFWEHVVLDVSHIRYDEQNPPNEKEWKRALQKDFYKARGAKLPTVFLDASNKKHRDFKSNKQTLLRYCRSMKNFECKDFETTMTEIDELKQEKDDILTQHKLDLENFKRSAEKEKEKLLRKSEEERIKKEEQEKQHKLDLENAEKEMKKLLDKNEKERIIKEKMFHQKEKEMEQKVKSIKKETEEEMETLRKERIEKEEQEKQHKLDLENLKRSTENEIKNLLDKSEKERIEKEEMFHQKEKEMDQKVESIKKDAQGEMETLRKEIEKDKVKLREHAEKKIKKEKEKIKQIEKEKLALQEHSEKKMEKIIENLDLVGKNVEKKIEGLEGRVDQQNHDVKEIVSDSIGSLNEQFVQHAEHIENRLNIQEQKIDHTKKTYEGKLNAMVEEGKKSDKDFENLYPSLIERSDGKRAWKSVNTIKVNEKNNCQEYSLKNVESGSVKATDGTKAARILSVSGENNNKSTKTILLVGMTGSGKSTLIDALINYVYDIHYTDPVRLKLISLTSEEEKKQANQATSQTDHITVYKIGWTPGMNIDFNVTLIDTPGLGDTRGIEYDKKMIKNIECLFNSKEVDTLDTIGFVAKSGDVRLTAEQKYIFESVLQIFGKDIGDNLVSLLTFYDNHALKILDAFKEANIQFVQHFPYNSQGIFQKRINGKIDRHILTSSPGVSTFQDFYNNSKKFFQSVKSMSPKSLKLTQAVLKDREHIEATVEGLSIRVKELLLLKDKVDQEKRICEQHEADAKANEDTEYEVTEDKVVKIDLNVGEFVTNCLECNRSCHYPCYIKTDEEKYKCAAMGRGQDQASTSCTVCPQNCHWQQHRNAPFRLDIQSETVKKTYDDIKNRHKEFLDKAGGQKTIIDALEQESQSLSNEIQSNVDFITECLHRLSQNALRTSTTSSSDYIEQMIQAEDHERKKGFQRRIAQLRKEKEKADTLANILSGKHITSGVHISAKKVEKAPQKSMFSMFKQQKKK